MGECLGLNDQRLDGSTAGDFQRGSGAGRLTCLPDRRAGFRGLLTGLIASCSRNAPAALKFLHLDLVTTLLPEAGYVFHRRLVVHENGERRLTGVDCLFC